MVKRFFLLSSFFRIQSGFKEDLRPVKLGTAGGADDGGGGGGGGNDEAPEGIGRFGIGT
jgi:hypothetical protein